MFESLRQGRTVRPLSPPPFDALAPANLATTTFGVG